MNGIQFKISATDEQIAVMEHNCMVSECLMAQTLARRIEGLKAEQATPFIEDWFRSVRQIAQANFMTSGIKFEVKPVPPVEGN